MLNDNGYAISPGSGALHQALQQGRAGELFDALGLEYFGVDDGHDLRALEATLERARASERLAIVHARTIKGRGWAPADRHPYRSHFSFAFDPLNGALRAGAPPAGYPEAVAQVIA